ncbi:SDR family oxidoreductase [Streptomyces sp. NPDC049954]|uniref:SDR family oxidoreductase n=1 Tax=Streptomyces sp. NPDC049954 TaxID=3155779 RepID=UPI0034469B95
MATTKPVTLLTGGSTGIGAATVQGLLERGHRVVTTGRDAGRLSALVKSLGDPWGLVTVAGDASDPEHVARAVETTVEHFGKIDHVVANAGFSTHDTVTTGDPEAMRTMLLTNVMGPTLLVRESLEELKESGGRIVLIGSVAGVKNTPGNFYSVTKWAVHALAENVRMLVTESGVGVSLIAPGKVDTPFWDGRGGTPPGPVLSPEDVARTVQWVLEQPRGVDINTVTLRPVGQPN